MSPDAVTWLRTSIVRYVAGFAGWEPGRPHPLGSRLLILASTSPRRRELLSRLGIAFGVMSPGADEPEPEPGSDGAAYAQAMAQLKIDAALHAIQRGLTLLADDTSAERGAEPFALHGWIDVVASDTTVQLGASLLGKPQDRADALRMHAQLSGSQHRVLSSVCARTIALAHGDVVGGLDLVDETQIQFRETTPIEREAYVDSGEAFGKAGAYAVQETGDRFVHGIHGRFSTIVGLPLAPLADWLRAEGYPVPPADAVEALDRRIG